MTELVDRIASILEVNFWDESDLAGPDSNQREKFKEVAREIVEAIAVPSKDRA